MISLSPWLDKTHVGDCRYLLRQMHTDGVKVQMCVTSPPYYGLRSYLPENHADKPLEIGYRQTPQHYIADLVEVFRAVREVLCEDGTLWIVMGDTYAGSRSCQAPSTRGGPKHSAAQAAAGPMWVSEGVKPKDMLGIPWALAFALRKDGWYLRQDIIWSKPNPMPESVRDRCTKAHEYVFLLSKSERYCFDNEAIKEPARYNGFKNPSAFHGKHAIHSIRGDRGGEGANHTGLRNKRSVWNIATRPYAGAHFATFPMALIEPCILAGSLPVGAYEPDDLILSPAGDGKRQDDPSMTVGRAGLARPRRDMEAVRPMSRAEQAAYAQQLHNSPYRAEMAMESGGETTFAHYTRTDRHGARAIPPALFDRWMGRGWLNRVSIPPRLAAAYRSVILDPFMGSGTTAATALRLQRHFIGCELNRSFIDLQRLHRNLPARDFLSTAEIST